MSMNKPQPGFQLMMAGGLLALIGLAIILWPEPGLMPHPLPFPPSAATRPIAGYAVFGYPLLAVGALIAIAGAVQAAVHARSARYDARS